MEFDKNELHILKYIVFYKFVSIGCTVFGGLGIFYGSWILLFREKPCGEGHLNNALIGASVAVLGMGYLMYCFVKIIEKFRKKKGNKGLA